jgi:hypothetical protein
MKIALIGDGMTQKWGPDCPELAAELTRLYARTPFEIDNHGLAGTRAGYGLWRVSHDYKTTGGTTARASATTTRMSSSSNRSPTPTAPTTRKASPTTAMCCAACGTKSSAPLPPKCCSTSPFRRTATDFGKPEQLLLTPKATRQRLADRATLFLEEALRIAQDEDWPTADAYTDIQKRIAGGDKLRRYINQSDSLHPSVYGYEPLRASSCAPLMITA